MSRISLGMLFLASAITLFAVEKPDLTGTWVPSAGSSSGLAKIEIEQNQDEIKLRELSGDNKPEKEFQCAPTGKECDSKGRDAKVSLWYNGPALIEMYQARDGKTVVKTRRKISEDGSTLTVEVMPIVPAGGKTETIVYRRAEGQTVAGANTTPAP
jgi:hypothetical protein